MITQIKGWHVALAFGLAFGLIIAVNLTLAFNAIRTFPGLEVQNSYVASQSFDRERQAQTELDWQVSARLEGQELALTILHQGVAIAPQIEEAIFGRATSVHRDQSLVFRFDGAQLWAPVVAGPGNWNLILKARADSGVLFQQRVIVESGS